MVPLENEKDRMEDDLIGKIFEVFREYRENDIEQQLRELLSEHISRRIARDEDREKVCFGDDVWCRYLATEVDLQFAIGETESRLGTRREASHRARFLMPWW